MCLVHIVHTKAHDMNGVWRWSCWVQNVLHINSLCCVYLCLAIFRCQWAKFIHAGYIVVAIVMIELSRNEVFDKKNKNKSWFHNSPVLYHSNAFPHTEGAAAFVSAWKWQVSLCKAWSTCLSFLQINKCVMCNTLNGAAILFMWLPYSLHPSGVIIPQEWQYQWLQWHHR